MMRIISGSHKGRRIVAPKNLPSRPTTDRSKEALFNILMHQWEFEGLKILDLFAGTGNISYEFCSRGVAEVVAVDQHRMCTQFIQKTAASFEFPIAVIQSDVFKFLAINQRQFDLVFADPPYDISQQLYDDLVRLVLDSDTLVTGGQFVMEHDPQWDWEQHPMWTDSRVYGSNQMSFFEKKAGR